jgi:hypothetical protein
MMTVRVWLSIWAALLLTACTGPGSGLTGNDTGGIIPFTSMTPDQAQDIAIGHCARYDKVAVPTGVDARTGGYYSFSCKFNRRAP